MGCAQVCKNSMLGKKIIMFHIWGDRETQRYFEVKNILK